MKSKLLLVIALALSVLTVLSVFTVSAAENTEIADAPTSGTFGDENVFNWSLSNDMKLVITGSGVLEAINKYDCPWSEYYDDIVSVEIGEGITSLGMYSIGDYLNLASISLPASLCEISDYALVGCPSLQVITVADGNENFKVVEGALLSAEESVLYLYAVARTNESFVFPDAVLEVKDYAFMYAEHLKSITLNDYVSIIRSGAFFGCSSLTEITLTQNVSSIVGHVFEECISLTAINVVDDNYYFTDIDGVLFDKDVTNLIFYPCAKELSEYTVPDSVKYISESAFSYAANIEKITLPEGLLEINGSAFFGCVSLKKINFPSSLKRIYAYAFSECSLLEGIELPATLEYLGNGAFSNCAKITEVRLPSSLKTLGTGVFSGCSALSKVFVPETVTVIPNSTFSGCSSLAEFTFHSKITRVESLAFRNCTKLSKVYFYAETTGIITNPFNGANKDLVVVGYADSTAQTFAEKYGYKFERLVKRIDYGYFGTDDSPLMWSYYDNNELVIEGIGSMGEIKDTKSGPWSKYINEIKTVTIKDGVTDIATGAFKGGKSLTKVSIPASVTKIGSNAFAECTALAGFDISNDSVAFTTVNGVLFDYDKKELVCYPAGKSDTDYVVPENVLVISDYAFAYCVKLNSVTISSTVEFIGVSPFSNCTALTAVNVNANNKTYKSIGGVLFEGDSVLLYYPLGLKADKYQVPESTAEIAANAFYGCSSISEITLPAKLEKIGDYAFYGCNSLKSIVIPDNVTIIPRSAFQDCTSLETVALPSSLVQIGINAFRGCYALNGITIPETVSDIGRLAFGSCSALTEIVIPENVSYISDQVFSGCFNLSRITFMCKDVVFGNSCFLGVPFNAVFVAEMGSFAEEYAYQNGYAFEILKVKLAFGAIEDGETKINWILYNTLELIISGDGNIPNYSAESPAPWKNYGDKIEVLYIEGGVTAIGDYAFDSCASLKEIYIGADVASVSETAFCGCSAIGYFKIDKANDSFVTFCGALFSADMSTLYVFPKQTAVMEFSVPDKVTRIADNAFTYCGNLYNISIPTSVTSIGNKAFAYCYSLERITFNALNVEIGNNVFVKANDELVIYAMAGSTAIKYAEANDIACVEIIASGSFGSDDMQMSWMLYSDGNLYIDGFGPVMGSDKEKSSVMPWSGYADQILKITLSDSVTGIGSFVFSGLNKLDTICISAGVTWIDSSAFVGCNSLANIYVDDENPIYKTIDGVLICGSNLVCYPAALPGSIYEVPEYIINISQYAFSNCAYLTEVILHKDVLFVESYAFYNCSALTALVVNSSMFDFKDCPIVNPSDEFEIHGHAQAVAELADKFGYKFVNLTVKFKSAAVILYNDLAINFKVSEEALVSAGYSDPYIVFTVNGKVTEQRKYSVDYSGATPIIVFSYNNISPDRLGDSINFKLYGCYNDTYYLLDENNYSVMDYCYNKLKDDKVDVKLKRLLVDLLNYGAAAQLYNGRNTDMLVNAFLTDEYKAFGTESDRELNSVLSFNGEATEVAWKSAGLHLKHNITIKFKFTAVDSVDVSKLSAVITIGGKETWVSAKKFELENGVYVINYNSFIATQLSDSITAVIVDEEGHPVSNELTYSVETYAYNKNNDQGTLGNLVRAMIRYGDSAKAFVSKK